MNRDNSEEQIDCIALQGPRLSQALKCKEIPFVMGMDCNEACKSDKDCWRSSACRALRDWSLERNAECTLVSAISYVVSGSERFEGSD